MIVLSVILDKTGLSSYINDHTTNTNQNFDKKIHVINFNISCGFVYIK